MARAEFPRSVKVACVKRATREGVVYCEQCQGIAKGWQIDHIDPDGLTGKPTLDNARLLCKPCHTEKTAQDVEKIARAKRREAKHLGVATPKGSIAKPPKAEREHKPPTVGMSEIQRRMQP